MDFEWDDAKAEINQAKHGVPFSYATRIFLDPHRLEFSDLRDDYDGEPRFIAIGQVESRVLVVAYTWRGDACRIISARKATRRERKSYEAVQTGS